MKYNGYKFRDYLQELLNNTIEAENKNKIYYYFPVTSLDLAKFNDLVNWGYNEGIDCVRLLWMIVERKSNKKYE